MFPENWKSRELYRDIIQAIQVVVAVVATVGLSAVGVSYAITGEPIVLADANAIARELQEQRAVLQEQNRLLADQDAELSEQRKLSQLFKVKSEELRERDALIAAQEATLNQQIATIEAQMQLLDAQHENVEDLKEWRTLQSTLLVLQAEVYALQTDGGTTAGEGNVLSRLVSFGTEPSAAKGLAGVPGKPMQSNNAGGAVIPLTPGSVTPDLTMGPQPYTPSQSSFGEGEGEAVTAAGIDEQKRERNVKTPAGNLITCVPPNPPNYAWIWLYRLDDKNEWQRISRGIGSINADGYLKLDGLPVDVTRFGQRGEPYMIEQVIDGVVTQRVGDFQNGGSEFRIYPEQDNFTPWQCR